MDRRKLLATTGTTLTLSLIGCLQENGTLGGDRTGNGKDNTSENGGDVHKGVCFDIEHRDDPERDDEAELAQSRCYNLLSLRLVFLDGDIGSAGEDIEVLESDDERVVDIPMLQKLLDNAVETPPEDRLWYEHAGKDFESVERTESFDEIDDPEAVIEAIRDLPCEIAADAPSGPYLEHDDQRFALRFETWTECEE